MRSYGDFRTVRAGLDDDGVLTLTLNRPEKMNSVDSVMVGELTGVLDRAAGDDAVRTLLITGAGRAFCAGRDISDADPDEDAYDIIVNTFNPLLARLYHLPKPTVSAVNGAAMGVGLGIALACDLVIAADNARFASPFARLGVALDSGGHFFLPRLIGYHRAMEMIYTGTIVRGKQAAEWGLVNRSVAGGRLLDRATDLARSIARGPVNAFIAEKAFTQKAQFADYDAVCADEALLQNSLMSSPEYEEGLAAFTGKRTPEFSKIPLRVAADIPGRPS
jgi:2-(1,2-epoxy-1,2-dihydrophenyl)acetyl-CoA isomerase